MKTLTSLAKKGKGKVVALLPDTQSSARYVQYDEPFLTQAFEAAGLSSDDFQVQNAQGSAQTMQTQAEAAITNGASVLLIDPLDSGSGAAIESNAASKGVKTIDYDRLTLNGSASYYVSFDNVKVGTRIGQGFVDCVTAWNVKKPQVLIMNGDPTDNNATLFNKGYTAVLAPKFKSGAYKKVAEPAGTWNNQQALTNFQQQYTAHNNINAAITPNDGVANSVISGLKTLQIQPKTFPTTGQDATLEGLQNILAGYQCMTVYKPIYQEAQAAVALALYLRAGQKPPSGLVNGATDNDDHQGAVGAPEPDHRRHEEHADDRREGRLRRRVGALRRFARRSVHRGRNQLDDGDGGGAATRTARTPQELRTGARARRGQPRDPGGPGHRARR